MYTVGIGPVFFVVVAHIAASTVLYQVETYSQTRKTRKKRMCEWERRCRKDPLVSCSVGPIPYDFPLVLYNCCTPLMT